ncbi:MAG TPA: prepilin-type N-terminal cleavage/methylation domain-containing protein [Bryobacteraceae bacterium]|nr:prepilin-type N-terminal cleavage/methylation domain-containing protein [Bryobacteraceae bacterium]
MKRSGVTLIEVLIAVSLLSLLSLGILFALRVGVSALEKTDRRLISNRRVAGAERILREQLAGFIPVIAVASPSPGSAGIKVPFFEGRQQSMRFVSTYSLSEASRGIAQILEFQVITGEQGRGVRLVVNENPYTGPRSAGVFCLGPGPDPESGVLMQRFLPISVGPGSFVLADKLAYCRFSFLGIDPAKNIERWLPAWIFPKWPAGIRIEMASLDEDVANLKLVTVTAAVRVNRDPALEYADDVPE